MNDIKAEERVSLSPAAIAQLHAVIAKDTNKKVLRVVVDSGGCSGFKYSFELDAEPKEDDLCFTYEGATLVVDPISFEFVKGAQVDYVQELIGAAFVIKNPNAASSCGCGSSFSL